MQQVAVVTDSSVGLPNAVMKQYNIRFVPLQIISGDTGYRDRIELTVADFLFYVREIGSASHHLHT